MAGKVEKKDGDQDRNRDRDQDRDRDRGRDPERDGEPEGDQALIASLARKIVEKKLEAPALFILEAAQPLSFMASQAMIFLKPLVQAIYPLKDYRRIAELFEDRKKVKRLVEEIESRARERRKGPAGPGGPDETMR